MGGKMGGAEQIKKRPISGALMNATACHYSRRAILLDWLKLAQARS
jgi:hypothetical protein